MSHWLYLVETKAQEQLSAPNVQRKQKAAVTWCERINQLPDGERSDLNWHYVLLGESVFYEWREKRASLAELCSYARIRHVVSPMIQSRLS
jgi:type III restriction enzyme